MALEYFFALCGTLTLEGGPIFWVATHRIHHQKSDQARRSSFSARWGVVVTRWLDPLRRDQPQQHPHDVQVCAGSGQAPVLRLAEQLSLGAHAGSRRVALGDRWAADVPVGHLPARDVGLHATWLVNSATHMWGSRRFATRDDSRNNWWVALIPSEKAGTIIITHIRPPPVMAWLGTSSIHPGY